MLLPFLFFLFVNATSEVPVASNQTVIHQTLMVGICFLINLAIHIITRITEFLKGKRLELLLLETGKNSNIFAEPSEAKMLIPPIAERVNDESDENYAIVLATKNIYVASSTEENELSQSLTQDDLFQKMEKLQTPPSQLVKNDIDSQDQISTAFKVYLVMSPTRNTHPVLNDCKTYYSPFKSGFDINLRNLSEISEWDHSDKFNEFSLFALS
jgi:hypothetical protein